MTRLEEPTVRGAEPDDDVDIGPDGASESPANDGQTVTLTGPAGNDYRLEVPAAATDAEIAAIAATVSTHLAADPADEPAAAGDDTDGTETPAPWRVAARRTATDRRTPPSGAGAWKLAGRPGVR